MTRIEAEDLLALSPDDLWALPEERHTVVFTDGEVVSHTRATIASVYLWSAIKRWPIPLQASFHLGDSDFTSKQMLAQINRVIWTIHAHYGGTVDKEELMREALECVNTFYNEFTVRLSPYVTTLSMFDMLEVMEHPTISKANADIKARPFPGVIETEVYPAITATLKDPTQLPNNPVAMAVRCGTLKIGQVLQCVGPRGLMTDINEEIFPTPIVTSYMEGIDDLYGSMIESRQGTKSLLYNAELLRGTEYFNRKSQLVAQYLKHLHPGDCGTPHTIDFPVMKNLLKRLRGKFYVDEASGTLRAFEGNEDHLVGRKVKLRSVLGCLHPDPEGICETCYGQLADSVPHNTNIGHVSAVIVGDKITSSVLSTKHLDSTGGVERFDIPTEGLKYLQYRKEAEVLYLKRDLRGKRIEITVFAAEVSSLADVLMLNDLSDYPIANASQLTQLYIRTVDRHGEEQSDLLTVSLYNRKASFSKELLEYIRTKQWSYDSSNNVVIDLTDFDLKNPFLVLPHKHVNMYEVMMKIQTFMHSGSESTGKQLGADGQKRTRRRRNFLRNYNDPVEGLVVFASMLNEKLSVNLVHCEILAYVMMVRSRLTHDYRLPKPGISGFFEKYNNIMLNRSMGGALAFEKQDRTLINPRSFLNTSRSDHPYDALIMGGLTSE